MGRRREVEREQHGGQREREREREREVMLLTSVGRFVARWSRSSTFVTTSLLSTTSRKTNSSNSSTSSSSSSDFSSLSSEACIEKEKKFGCANYAPLPVVLQKGEGSL